MAKFPVAWHEDCLKNMRGSLANAAKAKGMESFDSERLLKETEALAAASLRESRLRAAFLLPRHAAG